MLVHRKKTRLRSLLKPRMLLVVGLLAVAIGGALYVAVRKPDFTRMMTNLVYTKIIAKHVNQLIADFAGYTLPVVRLDVKFKHCAEFVRARNQAIQDGILKSENKKYVPGKLSTADKEVDVRLRLKGDLTDHLNTDKWSFRVKVKGSHAIQGMREFSLQRPESRNGIYEWYFFKVLRKEGILTPRYDFVRLNLNGQDKGIYALEEGFSKELLESQKRREGFIFRFDEDLMWDTMAKMNRAGLSTFVQVIAPRGNQDFYTFLDVANLKKRAKTDPQKYAQLESTIAMVAEAITNKKLPASEIFHVEKMGKFLALAEIWSARHGLNWHNLRFYLNPVIHRLEPIAFDMEAGVQEEFPFLPTTKSHYNLRDFIFSDLEIYKSFLTNLQNYAQPEFLENLQAEFKDAARARHVQLKADGVQWSTKVDWAYLKKRQNSVREWIKPLQQLRAHAVLESAGDKVRLEVKNLTDIPILIEKLRFGTKVIEFAKTIPGRRFADRTHSFELPPEMSALYVKNGKHLEIESRVLATQNRKRTVATTFSEGMRLIAKRAHRGFPSHPSPSEFLKRNPFFVRGKEPSTFVFKPGRRTISKTIVSPRNSTLVFGPGSHLRFRPDAGLVVHGTIQAVGRGEDPVVFEGSQGSWRGLFVDGGSIEKKQKSYLKNVRISGVKDPSEKGWVLTGGITFHESNVEIQNSRFENSVGEDLLNLIRSKFKIEYSQFRATESDALDVDFSDGRIFESLFQGIKGDAIDLSGATVELERIRINNVQDKAISAGEQSTVSAKEIEIEDSSIGVASKDLSTVRMSQTKINRSRIGVVAFQKKPEFGGGRFEGVEMSLTENKKDSLIQHRSFGKINHQDLKTTELDVARLYESAQ